MEPQAEQGAGNFTCQQCWWESWIHRESMGWGIALVNRVGDSPGDTGKAQNRKLHLSAG